MILQAILVGLVAGYGRIEQSWFGQQMIARPIWLCTLVGLLLGDLKQGVIIGGTLELIWAGVVPVSYTHLDVYKRQRRAILPPSSRPGFTRFSASPR